MEKPNLLIVDDEDGPRQSLRIVFKRDYNVFVASSGQEALAIAKENRINVAVCDILMSGMSGVEVLKALKDLDPKIEVVMLTAYETLETARQALRYGASDYLNKPFDIPMMRAAVAKAAQKHFEAANFDRTNQQLSDLLHQIGEQRVQEEMERTKGEIYASVLHDINSPLTVISGFIDLINQSMQDAATLEGEQLENIKGDLQHLTGEVARCFEISRRYLRFLNREAAENMSSNVQQILRDLRDLLRKHPTAHGHRLDVQQLDEQLIARINGTDLLQILLNLTINALQATERPHDVVVECERHTDGIAVESFGQSVNERLISSNGFSPQQPLVSLTISDTGPGIPPHVLVRMFEGQFTTKAADHGTGLGLSIVKRLVNNAGGAIRVKTEIGAGSRFTVFIPLQ
ncbi:response regulator [Verrucomicrobiota bacterium sgz303538]